MEPSGCYWRKPRGMQYGLWDWVAVAASSLLLTTRPDLGCMLHWVPAWPGNQAGLKTGNREYIWGAQGSYEFHICAFSLRLGFPVNNSCETFLHDASAKAHPYFQKLIANSNEGSGIWGHVSICSHCETRSICEPQIGAASRWARCCQHRSLRGHAWN